MSLKRVVPALVATSLLLFGSSKGTSQSPASTSASVKPSGRTPYGRLATEPATRRVWSGPAVGFEGRPSPDGRLVSMTDWSTGDLAVRDLVADATRRLTAKGSWATSTDFAETSVISPDGKTVVYGWLSAKELRFEIRAMSISGPDSGKVRTIYTGPDVEFAAPEAFTPDGRRVAAVIERRDRTHQIVVVALDGGAPVTLKSFDWRAPNDLSISPDGRWLAYDSAPDQKTGNHDVYVMSLDGRTEAAVVHDKGHDLAAGWALDGAHLLVVSERGGTPGLWAFPMSQGRPVGEPVLVRSDMWHMTPMGQSADGSVFYGVVTGQRDILTAVFDAATGKVVSEPTPAGNETGRTSPATVAFSPDGQYVAYLVSRSSGANPYAPTDVVIRSLDRGEVRRLSPDLSRISRVYWLAGGKTLLLRGSDQKGRPGIFRLALETGVVTSVYTQQANFLNAVAVTRDGSRIFFATNDSTFTVATVQALDLTSGAVRKLYSLPRGAAFAGIAVSPNGRQVAVGMSDRTAGTGTITLVSVDDGSTRELYHLAASEQFLASTGLTWSPDGRDIYFAAGTLGADLKPNFELRRVSVAGGKAQPLGLKQRAVASFQISLDGRHIAFGVDDFGAEVWIMQPPKLSAIAR